MSAIEAADPSPNGVLYRLLTTGQRSIHLILEPHTLAMLPIAYLINRADPFDRYYTGNCKLDESYRSVVNAGVRAYQLHTYLGLVQQHFGPQIRRLVYEHQLDALDGIGGVDLKIKQTMELIMVGLGTTAVTIPTDYGEVEVPVEMNVALLLLLDTPQSPNYSPDPARRSEQIGRMGMDVDWHFAKFLTRGHEDITDTFLPMLETTILVQNSIHGLQSVEMH